MTFWGRESSLGMNGDSKYFAQQHQGGTTDYENVEGTSQKSEEEYEDSRPITPETPPPVLPEISPFGKESSLLDEDLFKNIG